MTSRRDRPQQNSVPAARASLGAREGCSACYENVAIASCGEHFKRDKQDLVALVRHGVKVEGPRFVELAQEQFAVRD